MKTLNTRLLLLFLAIAPLSLLAQELKKEINRSFSANSETSLMISNSFGNVQMESWTGNEIQINVVITVEGKTESAAKEALERMIVEFREEGNRVMARTENKCDCGNKIKEFSIDYSIKVPSRIAVSLKNSFGDLFVQGHDGPVEIDVEHGDFKIRNLTNKSNHVRLSFGDGQAKDINGMDARIQHSDFNVENIESLRAYIQFSDADLNNVTALSQELIVQHSDVNIDVSGTQWEKLFMDIDFSEVDIAISGSAQMRMEVDASFSDVDASSAIKVLEKEDGFNSSMYRVSINGDSAPISKASLSHSDLSFSIR